MKGWIVNHLDKVAGIACPLAGYGRLSRRFAAKAKVPARPLKTGPAGFYQPRGRKFILDIVLIILQNFNLEQVLGTAGRRARPALKNLKACSSGGEHYLDTVGVKSSNLFTPTIISKAPGLEAGAFYYLIRRGLEGRGSPPHWL